MPAAIEYSNHGGLCAYVRYKPYKAAPINVRHKEPNRLIFECPDRDILLLRKDHHQWNYKPAEGVWDEMVNFGLTHPNSQTDSDMAFYMLNYTDYLDSPKSPNLRENRTRLPHESYIVADSGGFQLMMGRFDWLDPKCLIDWYNRNIDLGMVLDVPTHGLKSPEDILTSARAQRAITDFLKSEARSDLEFFNILHGHGDVKRKFAEVVHDDDITRLAMGGLYAGSYLRTIADSFSMIKENCHHYKHYHFLGVFNLQQVIPFLRFSSKMPDTLFTSDASTAVQNANSKSYALHPTLDSKWTFYDVGLNNPNLYPTEHAHLPCSCQVCSTLKYMDTLSVIGGAMITHILAHHNIYQMNRYVNSMRRVVANESVEDVVSLMMCQLGTRKGINESRWGVQLADEIATTDVENLPKLMKKYSTYLGRDIFEDEVKPKSLFSVSSADEEEPDNEQLDDLSLRKLEICGQFLEFAEQHSKSTLEKTKKTTKAKTEKVPKKKIMSASGKRASKLVVPKRRAK